MKKPGFTVIRSHSSRTGLPPLFGWFLVFLGTFFIAADLRLQTRIALLGTHADAVVTSVYSRRRTDILKVKFALPSGARSSFESSVNLNAEYEAGERVPVLYLPHDPSVAEIADWPQLWFGLVFEYVLGFACLYGGLANLRRHRRQRAAQ